MEGSDIGRRSGDGFEQLGRYGSQGSLQGLSGDAELARRQGDPIESLGEPGDGRIAIGPNLADNLADGLLDLIRDTSLPAENLRQPVGKWLI